MIHNTINEVFNEIYTEWHHKYKDQSYLEGHEIAAFINSVLDIIEKTTDGSQNSIKEINTETWVHKETGDVVYVLQTVDCPEHDSIMYLYGYKPHEISTVMSHNRFESQFVKIGGSVNIK